VKNIRRFYKFICLITLITYLARAINATVSVRATSRTRILDFAVNAAGTRVSTSSTGDELALDAASSVATIDITLFISFHDTIATYSVTVIVGETLSRDNTDAFTRVDILQVRAHLAFAANRVETHFSLRITLRAQDTIRIVHDTTSFVSVLASTCIEGMRSTEVVT